MEKQENKIWKSDYKVLGTDNPKSIAEKICSNLSEITNGLVYVEINKIEQTIGSMYTTTSLVEKLDYFSKQIKTTPLDKLGENDHSKIETYSISIKSPKYPDYNYRMLFMEFNFTFYPVKMVLDEAISTEMGYEDSITANNEEEFKRIFNNVVRSDKVTSIIEGLLTAIKINNR